VGRAHLRVAASRAHAAAPGHRRALNDSSRGQRHSLVQLLPYPLSTPTSPRWPPSMLWSRAHPQVSAPARNVRSSEDGLGSLKRAHPQSSAACFRHALVVEEHARAPRVGSVCWLRVPRRMLWARSRGRPVPGLRKSVANRSTHPHTVTLLRRYRPRHRHRPPEGGLLCVCQRSLRRASREGFRHAQAGQGCAEAPRVSTAAEAAAVTGACVRRSRAAAAV